MHKWLSPEELLFVHLAITIAVCLINHLLQAAAWGPSVSHENQAADGPASCLNKVSLLAEQPLQCKGTISGRSRPKCVPEIGASI